jgi:hypothetical protein
VTPVNSCTAVIEWLKALATPAIAVAGVVIACAQLRIADVRLTHDLYERRYTIYAAAKKFIQQLCRKRTITFEELSCFQYAIGDAVFVLDERLAVDLEQLKTKAIRAAELYDRISSEQASQAETQEHWDLLNWFSTQLDVLSEKFQRFLKYSRPWAKRFRTLAFVALSLPLLATDSMAQKALVPPTATEIFRLRSECAALGRKILDENIVGPALTQTQISRYNPLTNRCYVELNAQTADNTKKMTYFHTVLYDGQTGEMLASLKIENGQKSGMVFDRNHQTKTVVNAGWDDARDDIDEMMTDDRKQ